MADENFKDVSYEGDVVRTYSDGSFDTRENDIIVSYSKDGTLKKISKGDEFEVEMHDKPNSSRVRQVNLKSGRVTYNPDGNIAEICNSGGEKVSSVDSKGNLVVRDSGAAIMLEAQKALKKAKEIQSASKSLLKKHSEYLKKDNEAIHQFDEEAAGVVLNRLTDEKRKKYNDKQLQVLDYYASQDFENVVKEKAKKEGREMTQTDRALIYKEQFEKCEKQDLKKLEKEYDKRQKEARKAEKAKLKDKQKQEIALQKLGLKTQSAEDKAKGVVTDTKGKVDGAVKEAKDQAGKKATKIKMKLDRAASGVTNGVNKAAKSVGNFATNTFNNFTSWVGLKKKDDADGKFKAKVDKRKEAKKTQQGQTQTTSQGKDAAQR